MGQDGGEGGEEILHQDYVILEPQEQVHVVSQHLLQFVVTENEVGHNLLFFGLVRWTRASDRDRSDWIFDIN